jgi:dihydroorotase
MHASAYILGITVRVGRGTSGGLGLGPLHLAMEAADALGLPLMTHLDMPPPSVQEVLDLMRPGDILTHCFRPFPNAPVHGDGRVREEVMKARDRGVIFDIGHGSGSFGFATARQMLEHGFEPDVISSDVHVLNIDDGPAYDLLHTMSKFLCLGMDLRTVVRASTTAPAKAMRRPDLGTLRPGSVGDAAVLELREGTFEYEDVMAERITGNLRLFAPMVIVGGRLWQDAAL